MAWLWWWRCVCVRACARCVCVCKGILRLCKRCGAAGSGGCVSVCACVRTIRPQISSGPEEQNLLESNFVRKNRNHVRLLMHTLCVHSNLRLLGVSQLLSKISIIRPEMAVFFDNFQKRERAFHNYPFFLENVVFLNFQCVKGTFSRCYGVFCVF